MDVDVVDVEFVIVFVWNKSVHNSTDKRWIWSRTNHRVYVFK